MLDEGGEWIPSLISGRSPCIVTSPTEKSDSMSIASDGTITVKGNVNPGTVTLTGGVASVNLGNGNMVTVGANWAGNSFGDVWSGTTFEYIDAAGVKTTTTLTDTNLLNLGGNLYQFTGHADAKMDGVTFQDLTSAQIEIAGSSNQLFLNTSGTTVDLTGSGNTVIGTKADHATVRLNGSGNSVAVTADSANLWLLGGANNTLRAGTNARVFDFGDADKITVGANSYVSAGSHATVNAGQGSLVWTSMAAVINASSAQITSMSDSVSVNGSGNMIQLDPRDHDYRPGWVALSLSGSNNSIGLSANLPGTGGSSSITTSVDSLILNADGSLVMSGSVAPSVSLTGGVLTEQLGNGNVATMNGIYSGVTLDYTNASGAKTSTVLMDSNLVSWGGNIYEVAGDANAKMDNTIFLVDEGTMVYNDFSQTFVEVGPKLNVVGNSDTVFLTDAATVTLSGNGNTVVGSTASNADVTVYGTNNVVAVGTNSHVSDNGSGDTISVGAGSIVMVQAQGSNATINALDGGGYVYLGASGPVTINANGLQLGEFLCSDIVARLNGSGNHINLGGQDTLVINGSNNSVNAHDLPNTVATSTGSVAEQADGTIVLTGNVHFDSITLSGNTALVQMGNGNVVTMDAKAGTALEYIDASGAATWSVLQDSAAGAQANHLVAAMATYSAGSSSVGSAFNVQATNDSMNMLVASHH